MLVSTRTLCPTNANKLKKKAKPYLPFASPGRVEGSDYRRNAKFLFPVGSLAKKSAANVAGGERRGHIDGLVLKICGFRLGPFDSSVHPVPEVTHNVV